MDNATFYANVDLVDGFGSMIDRTKPHGGTDLPWRRGTPIPALFSGVVTAKGKSAELGHWTQVLSGDLYVTYCHSDEASPLPVGAQVIRQETTVNKVGASGYVTGPHLHLATSYGTGLGYYTPGTVDPLPFIRLSAGGSDYVRGGGDEAGFIGNTYGSEVYARSPQGAVTEWELWIPSPDTQLAVQVALAAKGRYNYDDGSPRPLDGIWGRKTLAGIQRTVQNKSPITGEPFYTGPDDGFPEGASCLAIQQYAAAWEGHYMGPQDRKLGPETWRTFLIGLQS